MPRKLCCFFCPALDFQLHELEDTCPTCGRPLGLPELEPPETIWGHTVVRALPRGFYSATYVVEQGPLRRPYVLKVCGEAVYAFFRKDFAEECRVHNEVARDSEHVVDIVTYTETPIEVGYAGTNIRCWVAQLEYIEGESLREFINREDRPAARSVAQVAVDLMSLMAELGAKERYHNDLHADNVIVSRLGADTRRPDQLDERIRAVAIDLGSITDQSKTGNQGRLGDLHEVAQHLLDMSGRLLADPQRSTDADYRLAVKLSEVAHQFAPQSENQRAPDYRQAIDDIRDALVHQRAPWDVPAKLRRLDESYNAQTLHPWFVPQLLVDPGENWLTTISQRGPLVVTGMRGCGKTMLLRGLELHARLARHKEAEVAAVDGIREDGYLGLYVSCTRLLDILEDPDEELHAPYARLFLAYAREAVRALRHLRAVAPEGALAPGYHRYLAQAIALTISGARAVADADSEADLERRVIEMLASLERREETFATPVHPVAAFPRLAEAIRACVPDFADVQVLFLLDDVSTRHLNRESISDLLSRMMFSDPGCAFKLTTETQTLELVLRSPGLIETARDRRDYDIFDLGRAVNEALKVKGGAGQRFISQILQQRISLTDDAGKGSPEERLGSMPLSEIALKIATTTATSAERKNVYRGIRALTAVCVGDIGDVISLYERMSSLSESTPKISPQIQSACYQEFCSRRLYTVNRRNGRLKDFALGFAEASHKLLTRSVPKKEKRGLRQYNSIYIRLTTGDITAQMERLRELTDAGVFVLSNGADSPRAKTRDRDPIQQFVLRYRKLFGMSSYIGLADRDRFELSGDDLAEWLEHPELGAEILTRNLTGPAEYVPGDDDEDDEEDEENEEADDDGANPRRPRPGEAPHPASPATEPVMEQGALDLRVVIPFADGHSVPPAEPDDESEERARQFARDRGPRVRLLRGDEMDSLVVDHLVLGLGFEERTEESARRLLSRFKVSTATAVAYPELGRATAMRRLLAKAGIRTDEVTYAAAARWQAPDLGSSILVDVTGLAKPVLFAAVSSALRTYNRVLVAHTTATEHYPLDADIEEVFRAEEENDVYTLLSLLDGLWSGEAAPYSFVRLLPPRVDDTRTRVLFASASPKHQRLLSLLDERDADILELLHPPETTQRGRLAAFAARLAVRERIGRLEAVESDDIESALRVLGERYHLWFVERNAEFEVALTGSKMHAVAAAAASVTYLLSQCWYVSPAKFDPERFTAGVGDTKIFEITPPASD